MEYQFARTQYFKDHYYPYLTEPQQRALMSFVRLVKEQGLANLPGKLKKSDKVPEGYSDRERRIKIAREHNLYHYHLGTPCWHESENGNYKTSDDVVIISKHVDKEASVTKLYLCGFSSHPVELPFPQDMPEAKRKGNNPNE